MAGRTSTPGQAGSKTMERPNFPLPLAFVVMLLIPAGLLYWMKLAPGSRPNLGTLHLLFCALITLLMPLLALFTRKLKFMLKALLFTGLSTLLFLVSVKWLLSPLAGILAQLLWQGRIPNSFTGILLYYLGMFACRLLCFIVLLPIGGNRKAGLTPGVLFVIALLPAVASFPLAVAADALRI